MWRGSARHPGKQGGDKAGRYWRRERRLALVRAAVDKQLNTRQVAQRFGVPYTTAMAWVARCRSGGETARLAVAPPKGT